MTLETSDGKTLVVPKVKLSAADRAWIASITGPGLSPPSVKGDVQDFSALAQTGKSAGLPPLEITLATTWPVGSTLYIQGPLPVRANRDFEWYNLPVETADDVTELKKQMSRFGVVVIPEGQAVILLEQRSHPKSGASVYRVRFKDTAYWVLDGDIAAKPKEWREKLHEALRRNRE